MKVNTEALCQAFKREWEVDTLPADFPNELHVLIRLVENSVPDIDDKESLTEETLEIITGNEHLFLNKHDENQIKILDEAREKLQSIMENLYDEDVPQEEIKKLFTKFTEEL